MSRARQLIEQIVEGDLIEAEAYRKRSIYDYGSPEPAFAGRSMAALKSALNGAGIQAIKIVKVYSRKWGTAFIPILSSPLDKKTEAKLNKIAKDSKRFRGWQEAPPSAQGLSRDALSSIMFWLRLPGEIEQDPTMPEWEEGIMKILNSSNPRDRVKYLDKKDPWKKDPRIKALL